MSQDAITSLLKETRRFEPPAEFSRLARVPSREAYDKLYKESLEHPDAFWRRETQDLVFRTPWTTTLEWKLPHAQWFVGATLNITESCLDRHLTTPRRNKAAIVWEGEMGETRTLTYAELHRATVMLADTLTKLGIEKGDRVAIYMGMVPEVAVAMLACARIGAVHTVVFGGFSADALRDRIQDCQARLVITQDGAYRRGQVVPLKDTVDKALAQPEARSVEATIVYQHLGHDKCPVQMTQGRDHWWQHVVPTGGSIKGKEPLAVEAEHPLFILYTSGSTGKPKGVLHTTAGYLAGVHVTSKYVFDLRDEDVYWCTADVGWVTGHSYIVYGPLANGATTLMFEGVPNYPSPSRFWDVVDKHKVNIFYTAPTAIRALMGGGDGHVKKTSRKSLRVLGSVGEPINPEAWEWYFNVVGEKRCPIVDTWWQTETGGILITPLPGAIDLKAGSATKPFFGVQPQLVDNEGAVLEGATDGNLCITDSWPGQMRTVYGDHERFIQTYFSTYKGKYFTGDGCRRDDDGYYWITGRVDDVINVSGHRIGTAEVESALVLHPKVAEAAVVGFPHDLKGQGIYAYVTLVAGEQETEELRKELVAWVRKEIGPIATPDFLQWAPGLPKTRSGKIMRRILRKIAENAPDQLGDTTTLADPSVVESLVQNRRQE